ncbi:MAG: hypothetical protein OEU46_20640, partial [Alphaproteobacteria bacterium]|nr:hypothetical protein [Alphaproteobacteria bacterium]
ETRPAAQGETETAWALNRRGVTFVLNADGKSRMTKLSAAPGPEQSTLTATAGSAANDWTWGLTAPATEDEIE